MVDMREVASAQPGGGNPTVTEDLYEAGVFHGETDSDWVVVVDGEHLAKANGFDGYPQAKDFADRARAIFPNHKYEIFRRDTKVTLHKWNG